MFWKFNLLTSQIDTLLDQEEVNPGSVTLEDVLDEDDVLQECKGQNKKLLDFLTRSENMVKLVDYVVDEPSDEKEEKVRFKYPNISCELLTSDMPLITDKLSEDEALLKKVYSFLENKDTLNPLQASFFSKVMGLLITRKSELMLDFIKSREEFVSHLVRHIGTSAIMDLLLRLITCIENSDTRNACISWLNEQTIIQKLVGLIDPSHTDEEHCNASQSLCDIIRIGRDQMSHMQERAENDPLLAAIESQEVVSSLLDHMFVSETKVESVLVNGLQVIQTLLEFRKLGPEGLIEQMTQLDSERLTQGVNNTIASISPRLKDLQELLVNPPKQHYHTMCTTVGCLEPPLGNTRLQVVRLITSLLITNTHHINVELVNLGTVGVIIDLFFKYGYNNFLHTQVEQCLCTVLNMCPVEDAQGAQLHPLLDQLFSELRFIERILNTWEEIEENKSKPGVLRPGYMGHLTQLANHIGECCEKGHNAGRIKDIYKEYPEKLQERWEGFVSGSLADMNKTNTADLVGSMGLHSSSDSEDPDFSSIAFPQESAMQQAFSDYQLQQMTSTFIDQFGFNEDEFAEQEERVDAPFTDRISSINFEMNSEESSNAATLFEQACNEKMQQFDDPDSDEDLWEDKDITFTKNSSKRDSGPSRPQTGTRGDSEEEEDQNSEGSTDSDEELSSPQRIYQVPSSSAAVTTTSTSVTTSSNTTPVDAMDVDSSEAWADFSKMGSSPVAMDDVSSPWDQPESSSTTTPAESASNSEGNWAKFGSSPDNGDKENKGEEAASSGQQQEQKWADFTKFEDMEESSDKPSKSEGDRSVSPVAMDTNESPSSSSRMNQYMVSSGAADSSQQPTSSSMNDEDISPPGTPRQAWDTPRDSPAPVSTPREPPPAPTSSPPPLPHSSTEQVANTNSSQQANTQQQEVEAATSSTTATTATTQHVPDQTISSTHENSSSSDQPSPQSSGQAESETCRAASPTQQTEEDQSPDTTQADSQSNSSGSLTSSSLAAGITVNTSTCVDTGISMVEVTQDKTSHNDDKHSNRSPNTSAESCIQGCKAPDNSCHGISSSSGCVVASADALVTEQGDKVTTDTGHKSGNLSSTEDGKEEDLSDNFNFLASSGLMRESGDNNEASDECSSSHSNSASNTAAEAATASVQDRLSGGEDKEVTSSTGTTCSNTDSNTDSSTQETRKLEESRAQDTQVTTAQSSSPNSRQNGPV